MSVTRNVCNEVGACHSSVELDELLYVAGVNANLCDKFMALADIVSLHDCEGNVISITTPIVTCDAFVQKVCDMFALLESSGPVTLGTTELVGADCTTYTVPETVLSVVDSSSIDLTASGSFGHAVRADIKLSATGGNAISLNADGIYAPAANICTLLATVGAGSPTTPNVTSVIGADCLTHVVTETFLNPTDSPSIAFLVAGTSDHEVTASVIIDPGPDNLLELTADGLAVTCTAVNACIDICTPIAARPLAGEASPTTHLLADDCNTYTLPPIFTPFTFTSGSATSHVIIHSLNNAYPTVTVWDTGTGKVIVPSDITSDSVNQLTITFFVATAIAGTIVG